MIIRISILIVAMVVLAATLVGCVRYVADPGSVPSLKSGTSVALGTESYAATGTPMLIEYQYQAAEVAVTTSAFSRGLFNAEINIPSGLPLYKVQRNGTTCFLTSTPVKRIFFGGPLPEALCLVDEKATGIFTLALPTSAAIDVGVGYEVSVPYHISEIATKGGYKHEVIYEGVAGNALHAHYQHFSSDMQKPDKEQELVFTIDKAHPTEFAILNAHFVVVSTDNNGIRYKVSRYFEGN